MLEISGNDITSLSDADLRLLVFQLAIAELRANDYPLSSVTAGGNQDAADGGLDVRVECPSEIKGLDFVPRRLTGFQVKKPDMPASAIREEMRPKNVLREVIRELADASGAYVMVSSQGSVADKQLKTRRNAIRESLHDLRNAEQLYTDFYDRERLATWTNEYPGVSAWVRERAGRPLSGWSSIGNWENGDVPARAPYLFDEKACLIDEHSKEHAHLPLAEGIKRLRAGLGIPRHCIRIVGLSGLGKTRLVQALFEKDIGENPLDPSLAVYTDYSEETDPTAREMARQLISQRKRAILIVDNCNPLTHTALAHICASEHSEVSLLTVEYDVGDDEPEHTNVFRLQSASPELVTEWIKRTFPSISGLDRAKIGEFSDGNFRIARALAETLGKGETLGSLKSAELFERLFRQRNPSDPELLRSAQHLSLLYSIDGEDVAPQSELGRVSGIRGIGIHELYETLAEMRRRGIVQVRGRFCAILPHAIANRLAAQALDRIPPVTFDRFCQTLSPRMLKSVSRRISFLHDSPAARDVVTRWLRVDGPVGDLMQDGQCVEIITNIAPVAPEAVLTKLEQGIAHLKIDSWTGLIKSIGYDAVLFDRAATLLAHFAGSEPKSNNLNSAGHIFREMFHLYFSGTKATPEQRRSLVMRFATSSDQNLRNCAPIAIRALLKSHSFSSSGSRDFGARSRDWGWHPKTNQDIGNWLGEAITLALELLPDTDVREVLANGARFFWRYSSSREALSRAATVLIERRPWVEAWITLRTTLRYDGENMPDIVRLELKRLIDRLAPSDPLNQARAILNRANNGYDLADDDGNDIEKQLKKAEKMARDLGRSLADETAIRAELFAELFVKYSPRAFEFGIGLAEGAEFLNVIWYELATAYGAADPHQRGVLALGGFIFGAHQRDPSFSASALEALIDNPELAPILPYLQRVIGIDQDGILRLRRAIAKGALAANDFQNIANGCVSNSPSEPLAALLEDIATLPGGIDTAIEILQFRFQANKSNAPNLRLISVGRNLLTRIDFGMGHWQADFATYKVIEICLAGEEGKPAAEKTCANIHAAFRSYRLSSFDTTYTLSALFRTQPFVALDAFLLPQLSIINLRPFDTDFRVAPVDGIDSTILRQWADRDPDIRFPILGNCLSMFVKQNDENLSLSPLFLEMLSLSPNKQLFLGDISDRLRPTNWSGSLADVLVHRKAQLMNLAMHENEQVRIWVASSLLELDRWIKNAREGERNREESFE